MTVQYVDLNHGNRGNRCQVSRDGLVCLEHEREWPCPVGELRAQLAAALLSLEGPYATTEAHLERALELAQAVR